MVEGEEKKRYGGLMTEHERLVNDKDIKSYENGDRNIHSKIPGFGGGFESDKQKLMVEKALGNGRNPY